MDYNQVIERIGEVIDGAGVAVIVVGAVIAAGTAVELDLARRITRTEWSVHRPTRSTVKVPRPFPGLLGRPLP